MEKLRVLELYSGIGGMHYALNKSGIPVQVVAAIDINTVANQIYRHNFPDTPLWNKTIEGITLDDFNALSFDMILMSPPCQPFTRPLATPYPVLSPQGPPEDLTYTNWFGKDLAAFELKRDREESGE
ncbi:tRNA (cytosine(38)-C(5))-methyltransferase [Collichthys lucidus]|uniref:tRNA (Cytosine(38)-C(5))-methyltransferase n=1 Tax=Collichthys lucidus TaxID=240159 RepID=A0A4U5VIF2_COLLU|nr:tRNA (cytosine(38)-C(5))-methyltransferase [Collichthys lucidus]